MSDKDTTPVSGAEPDTGRSVPAADPAGSGAGPDSPAEATDPTREPAEEPAGRGVLRRALRRNRGTGTPGDGGAPANGPGGRGRLSIRGRAGARGTSAADPAAVVPADEAATIATSIGRLAEADIAPGERKQLLGRLATELRARGIADTFKPRNAMRWVADAVGDIVPHLPIRRLDTLRGHFSGLSDDEIAERLVRNAARATAAVGAAGGGIAAVEWVAAPSLLTAPVLLATETVAVVAIEIKLIGELHELYGEPVPGTPAQRTVSLLTSWSQRRGVNPLVPGVGVAAVLGTAARKELRDRLLRRFGRNLTSYGPLLTGAAVASYLNRRATLALATNIRDDLRRARRRVIEAG